MTIAPLFVTGIHQLMLSYSSKIGLLFIHRENILLYIWNPAVNKRFFHYPPLAFVHTLSGARHRIEGK
ncbi:hypothetical protein PDENDC454_17858 [Paenibacillus dendritiformis C454]|uniref:Uncharacterized protein n=1 Tax=Paenibacillus dendritiformis C454 TaxID=1131935 RepID=H3SJ46_9BACL|nr:hypothetical protein PDENDC454_17858 [Paenibacillus dendritiformis C454]